MRLSRAKAYCKVVFKSAKNSEATNFHGNPYYFIILADNVTQTAISGQLVS